MAAIQLDFSAVNELLVTISIFCLWFLFNGYKKLSGVNRIVFLFGFIFFTQNLFAQNFVIDKNEPNAFPIVSNAATPIYTDKSDDWLIQKSA